MSRIRILHLRAGNFVGGPERQLLRYGAYHQDARFELVFAGFEGQGETFRQALAQRRLETLVLPAASRDAIAALRRYVDQQEVALVCTHGYKADVIGLAACRGLVPVAPFLRGWTSEDLKVRAYEALDRLLLPFASRVVCLSETHAQQMRRRSHIADKVRVVINAIEPPLITPTVRHKARHELRERFGLPSDCPVLASAGRLSPEKGTRYFIEAFATVAKSHPQARAIVFGEGPLRLSLQRLAVEPGIADRVVFAGFVPDFPRLLAGADVLVNPSLKEQMPNVVLEAMAAAIPVVATPVGAVAEIAGHQPPKPNQRQSNANMLLVEPRGASLIATAITDLLRDPERARAIGLRARQRVLDAYSPSRQQQQLRALYEELTSAERGSAVYSVR